MVDHDPLTRFEGILISHIEALLGLLVFENRKCKSGSGTDRVKYISLVA